MAEIIESGIIAGVKFANLKTWADNRGRFLERSGFPSGVGTSSKPTVATAGPTC